MAPTPHYLRVARALALVSGLAGLPGCAMSTTLDEDSGPRVDASDLDPDASSSDDAGTPVYDAGPPTFDAGHVADARVLDCSTCECGGWAPIDAGPDVVSCETTGREECCAAIGPLFPPDLAA